MRGEDDALPFTVHRSPFTAHRSRPEVRGPRADGHLHRGQTRDGPGRGRCDRQRTEARKMLGREGRPILGNLAEPPPIASVFLLEHEPSVPEARIHQVRPRSGRLHMPDAPANSSSVPKRRQAHEPLPIQSGRHEALKRPTRCQCSSIEQIIVHLPCTLLVPVRPCDGFSDPSWLPCSSCRRSSTRNRISLE